MHSSRKLGAMPETTPTPEIKAEPKPIHEVIANLMERVEALEKRIETVKDEATAHTLKTFRDRIHISNI